MDPSLIGVAAEVFGAINDHGTPASGPTNDSNFQVKMNEFEEGTGITFLSQVLLAGPSLEKAKEDGSVLFPDKTDDDMYVYIAIRCKGDPQEGIDNIKGLIEAFGLPVEMLEEFGELKYHAGDGEILIGFKAKSNEHVDLAKQFTVKSTTFGDGSEDISVDCSVNLATTFDEMLDENPLFTHFLKGGSFHFKSHVHESSRDIIMNIIEEKMDSLQPILDLFPFVVPLGLFKKFDGILELQCTDEMKEKIKEFATNAMPPAAMSLKELLEMVKGSGMPIEMVQPVLELVQNIYAGEVSINIVTTNVIKLTLKTPGLDQIITEFLSD